MEIFRNSRRQKVADRKRRRRPKPKFNRKMRGKLLILFAGVTFALIFLIGRIVYIDYTSSDKYKKKVLALQSYDSKTLPYQRGDIVDRNGTKLATSVAVYNVILDCSVMTSKQEYIRPTIDALMEHFENLDRKQLEDYARNKKDSRYIILKKKASYKETQPFIEMMNEVDEDGNKVNPNIKGVWFETEYVRNYPFGSLASSVIGFTSAGNVGTIGLENYYNDTLNGVNGREYGYLNSDSAFEKTVIKPEDGNTLVTTIDSNIQSVVEKKIKEFCKAYKDNYRKGNAAENIGVIVQNPQNGEILAMANYPSFDLNNPRDLSSIMSKSKSDKLSEEKKMEALNGLWQNYCVTSTYEPGSVQKPFTVACGLETGTVNKNNTYECDGGEKIAGQKIRCVNRSGHGTETVEKALMDSCNDALMQMSYQIGVSNFLEYQSIFGFGYKTGIDLPGEANTSTLVFKEDNIKKIDLATNSFGQNYNCTMIELISAFSSLVNGGTYYQPHLVKKITNSEGNTISTMGATAVKQTVSKSTSDTLKGYMYNVVEKGTAATAKVDGYSMGGKTGTAEKYDEETHTRKKDNYLVSFIGFAPLENPQLVIYCVVDRPNVESQYHSTYAQNIVREILEETFPYMNIYPDEKKTGKNKGLDITGNETN